MGQWLRKNAGLSKRHNSQSGLRREEMGSGSAPILKKYFLIHCRPIFFISSFFIFRNFLLLSLGSAIAVPTPSSPLLHWVILSYDVPRESC